MPGALGAFAAERVVALAETFCDAREDKYVNKEVDKEVNKQINKEIYKT